jgi:hypothetical protein
VETMISVFSTIFLLCPDVFVHGCPRCNFCLGSGSNVRLINKAMNDAKSSMHGTSNTEFSKHIQIFLKFLSPLRRVRRYQRGNQNPNIEEEPTTQWPKEKIQKDKQRSTKHTYKTKDRVTRTPLKTGGKLRCSGKVVSRQFLLH